ncbi:MAG TPA: hypothetical protein VFW66_10440 [Gemmatimonadales bacterium]|nr:hypothetical protein [Gemmatimonadales bacterium]
MAHTAALGERALAGEDLSALPVHGEHLPPAFARLEAGVQARYDSEATEISAWLERRHAGR